MKPKDSELQLSNIISSFKSHVLTLIKYPEYTSIWSEHARFQFSPVKTHKIPRDIKCSVTAIGPELSFLKVKVVKNAYWL